MVPAGVQLQQQLPDLADALRVEAVRRLVQHQQVGLAQQRRSQPEPLPHAERVRLDRPAADPAEADLVQHLVHPAGAVGSAAAGRRVAAGVEQHQVRPAGQVAVGAGPFDQRADPAEHPRGRTWASAGRATRSARGGQHQAEQHPHRGGLAGAVRAEKAVDIAGADVQVDWHRPRPASRTAWSGRGCGSSGDPAEARQLASAAAPALPAVTVPTSSQGRPESSNGVSSRFSGPSDRQRRRVSLVGLPLASATRCGRRVGGAARSRSGGGAAPPRTRSPPRP